MKGRQLLIIRNKYIVQDLRLRREREEVIYRVNQLVVEMSFHRNQLSKRKESEEEIGRERESFIINMNRNVKGKKKEKRKEGKKIYKIFIYRFFFIERRRSQIVLCYTILLIYKIQFQLLQLINQIVSQVRKQSQIDSYIYLLIDSYQFFFFELLDWQNQDSQLTNQIAASRSLDAASRSKIICYFLYKFCQTSSFFYVSIIFLYISLDFVCRYMFLSWLSF
ncbi:transmembrane protein, putative (macronuclear) [Tetrahymena thermophila SB210]|uniref:Transmembrane protein, putative n=1 Tax=Tetrahymena thermophila (strain SB210) TaxID=312017 RepID=Q22LT5_TETTS|nr:transmembrane protein, putative [Tetrahymena thermophila SB210]EAR86181.2 transmembrane protein, putative [Tetrahymena thermophila SB210]|eukprot:XP_976776.2 transmembrane protein, putative [Tetrahymena thermophila SB210]